MRDIITHIDNEADIIAAHALESTVEQLNEEIVRMRCATYDTPYAFAMLPEDVTMVDRVLKVAKNKRALSPSMLIVIGIGGSNLGSIAIEQALLGVLYNDGAPDMSIYYADTVDADYIYRLIHMAERAIQQGKHILINVISKSGTTTETIVNFHLFLALLKQYYPDTYGHYVVITTDKGSSLWLLAHEHGWDALEVPTAVGGRYSVFSPVGLFPMAMLGIQINELLAGARHMRNRCIVHGAENPAARSAAWQYQLVKQGYTLSNLFLFSNELQGCGHWWRQLMGESLGKGTKHNGQRNHEPLVPLVSIGTTDLHSVGQLYLSSIISIMTTFVIIEQGQPVGKQDQRDATVGSESLSTIMHAIIQGVQRAYTKSKLPYRTIVLPELKAYYIGQFLQQSMFEVVYVGYLLNINPFNQPAVELYKREVRELLTHE